MTIVHILMINWLSTGIDRHNAIFLASLQNTVVENGFNMHKYCQDRFLDSIDLLTQSGCSPALDLNSMFVLPPSPWRHWTVVRGLRTSNLGTDLSTCFWMYSELRIMYCLLAIAMYLMNLAIPYTVNEDVWLIIRKPEPNELLRLCFLTPATCLSTAFLMLSYKRIHAALFR